MKSSIFAALVVCAAALSLPVSDAAPLRKRQASATSNNDVKILNFALTLENLEATFYQQALSRFGEADFRRANIPNPTQAFQNFQHIAAQEAAHVQTLQTVIQSLGGTPVPTCEFNFPFTDVPGFIKLAGTLEKVGVSAYNGAVALLQNGDLQTAAASIDTVEARHASFIQTAAGLDPFASTFDVPLDGRSVVTLASPLIKACPFDIGFAPFGTLAVATNQVLLPGSTVPVQFNNNGQAQFCNWLFSDQSIVVPLTNAGCQIPPNARGDVFLMVTSTNQGVTIKNTNGIVAGPVVVSVDTAHVDSSTGFVGASFNVVDGGANGLVPQAVTVVASPSASNTTSSNVAANSTSTASSSVANNSNNTTSSSVVGTSQPPQIQSLLDQVASIQAQVSASVSASVSVSSSSSNAANNAVVATTTDTTAATPTSTDVASAASTTDAAATASTTDAAAAAAASTTEASTAPALNLDAAVSSTTDSAASAGATGAPVLNLNSLVSGNSGSSSNDLPVLQ